MKILLVAGGILCLLVLVIGERSGGKKNDGLELAEAQIEWLRAKGGFYSPKISIKPIFEAENAPLGVFAAESISKGEKIMVVPRHCLLTAGPSSEDVCDTALNLIKEFKLKEQSDFAPYVSYLFSKDRVPLPSTWSDLGQNLIRAIRGKKLPPTDLTDLNFEEYCGGAGDPQEEFAYLTVVSRAWSDKLVPVFDMINHHSGRFANVDSTRVHGPDDITVHATRDIAAGEQLFLSYMDCIDEIGYELTYVLPQILRDFGFVDQYPQRWNYPVGEDPGMVFELDFRNEKERILYKSGVSQLPGMNITWRTHKPNDAEIMFLTNELHRLEELHSYVTETINQLEDAYERDVSLEYYQSLMLALRSVTGSTAQEPTCSVSGDGNNCGAPNSEILARNRQMAKDTKYEGVRWDDLPKEASEALDILDYDEETWDANPSVDIEYYGWWEDLSEEQMAAAAVLGWDSTSWNKKYEKASSHSSDKRGDWMACTNFTRIPYDYEAAERFHSHYQVIDVYYSEEDDDACLYLNNYLHTCASSRPHYHEVFVHYAARFVDQIKRVIYIGGGDSMVLHEVLKYPSLELVVGLELDHQVTRATFKNFGTQPHWDNEKVQWWYGDAAESLLLLPRDYYGSFDLVIVDILTEVAQSLKVNHELNVIEAAMLLMKPGGIIVKNEDEGYAPGATSDYTDYSVDLIYHDVPLYCLQVFVLGSNTVDFLTAKPNDHNIETLYLGGVDDFQAQFDSWYNFGTESSRSRSGCQPQHNDELTAPDENMGSLGVLMVLEAENTMDPLISATALKPAIIQALSNVGLFETASLSFPLSEDTEGFTLVLLVPEGYVVARCFALLRYCAFDIQLWGAGIPKLDLIKTELLGTVKSQHSSSYRMITGGMSGGRNEEKERLGPPPAKELCNSQTDGDQKTPSEAKVRRERRAEDFEPPQASTLHAYNLTSPLAQWKSQRPIGVQTIMLFEVPPFVVGEKVLIKNGGIWLPGTVVELRDEEKYDVIFDENDAKLPNVAESRIKKLTGKLDVAFMSSFLAETMHLVLMSVASDSETLPRKEVSEEIGDGLVIIADSSEGTIVATWDGRSLVQFNLFLLFDDVDFPSGAFNKVRRQKLAHWRLAGRDDFPRGIGSVVNFKPDIESPPFWAEEWS